MRLIDADSLIKAIEQGEGFSWDSLGKDDLCVRKKYIDNASTVESEIKIVPIANITFDTEKLKELTDEIANRIKRGEIVLQDERLQGEWIKMSDRYSIYYTCNLCGWDRTEHKSNFCPNCGAIMKIPQKEMSITRGYCDTCKHNGGYPSKETCINCKDFDSYEE